MATTDRLGLPLLAVAQAQKEVTHNEALTLLDAAVQPVVVAETSSVPSNPTAGQAWIVGPAADGAWAGRAGAVAAWTQGGWRFVAPFEGMAVWDLALAMPRRRAGSAWLSGQARGTTLTHDGYQVVGPRQPAIAAPSGGSTVDVEARATIAGVLAALRTHGLIST